MEIELGQNSQFFVEITICFNISIIGNVLVLSKLDSIAPLVAEPPQWNSTTRQNPLICYPSAYITGTLKKNYELKKKKILNKYQISSLHSFVKSVP